MILRFPALLLSAFFVETAAWTANSVRFGYNHALIQHRLPNRRLQGPSTLKMRADDDDSTPENDDFDEDCADEDECEIDWSMMPGAVPDTPETTQEKLSKLELQFAESSATTALTPSTSTTSEPPTPPDFDHHARTQRQRRQNLEMTWQMRDQSEECDVYEPATCGGRVCESCAGRGRCPCRFCRGTGSLHLTSVADNGTATPQFLGCTICAQVGTELCKACQGTGWIADWTDVGSSVVSP